MLLVANYEPDVGYAWWLMERFWLQLSELCRRRGARCLLAFPRPGVPSDELRSSGVETTVRDFRDRSPAGLRGIWNTLRRYRIRDVYLTDWGYAEPVFLLFRAAGVRTIVNHDHTPGDRPPVTGPRAWAKAVRNRIPGLAADHWISLSPLMRQRAILNGRIPSSRVSVVPNGIEPIVPADDARAALRAEFGIPDSHLVVVNVGRAHPYKRIDFVIRVADRMFRERSDVPLSFLHIGDGPALEALRRQAERSGLRPPRFTFAGRRDDVRRLLPGCDIALHASRGEGFSLAVLEYMSAGLATLVPDVPSVAQAITHGRTGVVYPDADERAACAALQELLDSREARCRLGEAARREVDRHHTLEHSLAAFRDLAEVLFGPRAPGET